MIKGSLVAAVFMIVAGGSTVFAQSDAARTPDGGTLISISHSVIAGGGGYSQWTQPDFHGHDAEIVPTLSVEGTIGQPILGYSANGQYNLQGGFWFADPLQPTAGNASISGRLNNLGSGANRRVRVVLTNLATGERRIVAVNAFGYYVFDDLEVSELYLVRPVGKGILFDPETRMIRLLENVVGVDFNAIPIE